MTTQRQVKNMHSRPAGGAPRIVKRTAHERMRAPSLPFCTTDQNTLIIFVQWAASLSRQAQSDTQQQQLSGRYAFDRSTRSEQSQAALQEQWGLTTRRPLTGISMSIGSMIG